MMQFGPKAKLITLGVGFLIIVFGRVNIFFSVQKDTPLENDIKNTPPENELTEINIDIDENTSLLKEDTINTPIIDNKENKENKEIEVTTTHQKKVSMLFPPIYDKETVQLFTTIMEEQTGSTINAKHITSRDKYRLLLDQIAKKQTLPVDIIIVPSDWRESFITLGKEFTLPDHIERFYHQAFSSRMYDKSVTILPLGLDPLIIESTPEHLKDNNILTLFSNILTLGKGFNKEQIKQLEEKTEPFLHANSVIEMIIDNALSQGSLDLVLLFVNNNQRTGKSNKGENHWIPKFLSENVDYKNTLHLIPTQSNYPTRGWGIIINEKTKNPSLVEDWIRAYLTVSIETNTLPYPHGLLGATYSMLTWQLQRKEYISIQQFNTVEELYVGTIETDDDILYDKDFLEAVVGTIDQKQLMQKMSNKR